MAAGQGRDGGAELSARRRRVDRALAAYRASAGGLGRTGDPALDRAVATAAVRLDRLAVQRALVDRRLVPPERAGVDHDTMVAALGGVARVLADRLTAPGPARVARLLLAVTEAKEATGQERTLLAAAPPGPATVPLAAAAAVARQELGRLRAAAGDRLERIDRTLGLPRVRTVRGLELALLQPAAGPPPTVDLTAWRDGLADRLRLLDGLARDESDPHRRQGLAGAGHLATRLRRAAEALLAVTGASPDGRRAGPAPVITLLRAAVAEAEATGPEGQDASAHGTRRVQLVAGDEVEVDGRAGSDLVHLLAELLDNAAGFSPPTARIVVTGVADGRRLPDRGQRPRARYDRPGAGLGQPAAGRRRHPEAEGSGRRGPGNPGGVPRSDQADLRGGAPDDRAGDRLGLAIVARLARGHGFAVRLGPSPEGGVTATVRLPATALQAREPAPVRPR